MKPLSLLLLTLVAACDGAPTDTEDTASDDAPCVTIATGEYRATGACFAMAMRVDLTFDEGACAFTLDNWSMNHGNPVQGGTLDDATVTLAGSGWEDCIGEVDGDTLGGTCPDDGCAWEFGFQQ